MYYTYLTHKLNTPPYIIVTQTKSPSPPMVQLLQNRLQPITLYKVGAHVNIDGNEQANKLAKEGLELEHRITIHPYEHAHATPYYYQKDVWASMSEVPDKGPVRFL
jgi:hypothetical protein